MDLKTKEEDLRKSLNHLWQLSIAFSCLVGTLRKYLENELKKVAEEIDEQKQNS